MQAPHQPPTDACGHPRHLYRLFSITGIDEHSLVARLDQDCAKTEWQPSVDVEPFSMKLPCLDAGTRKHWHRVVATVAVGKVGKVGIAYAHSPSLCRLCQTRTSLCY